MNDWTAWAEGLAAAANRAGMNKTAADFPYRRPRWDDPADYCEGRDDSFDHSESDRLSDLMAG